MVYAYNANETTHSESEIPWYHPLCGSFWSISGFRQTHLGRVCTHGLVCTMELLRIAPKGSAQVSGVASGVFGPLPRSLAPLNTGRKVCAARARGVCYLLLWAPLIGRSGVPSVNGILTFLEVATRLERRPHVRVCTCAFISVMHVQDISILRSMYRSAVEIQPA